MVNLLMENIHNRNKPHQYIACPTKILLCPTGETSASTVRYAPQRCDMRPTSGNYVSSYLSIYLSSMGKKHPNPNKNLHQNARCTYMDFWSKNSATNSSYCSQRNFHKLNPKLVTVYSLLHAHDSLAIGNSFRTF